MSKYRFSLILILCLFLVTGGVFVTWAYNEFTSAESKGQQADVNLEVVTEEGTSGSLSIKGLIPNIIIDDAGNHTSSVNHIYLTAESVDIIFTPYADFKQTEKAEYNIKLFLTEGENKIAYNGVEVFIFNDPINKKLVSIDGGETYHGILTQNDFRSMIKNVNLILPTEDDYSQFEQELIDKTIFLTLIDNGVGFAD